MYRTDWSGSLVCLFCPSGTILARAGEVAPDGQVWTLKTLRDAARQLNTARGTYA